MTLHEYAEKIGVKYQTAWNQFKEGKIVGAFKTPTGQIVIPDDILEVYKKMWDEKQQQENKDKDGD